MQISPEIPLTNSNMKTKDYLRILKDEIHSTVIATIDEKGRPVTRVIDIMLTDENSLYFITAKGKAFYSQLMMAEIYPQEESGRALEVFQVAEGTGEFFDLSVKPIYRDTFVLGAGQQETEEPGGYFITDRCHGCRICYSKCPQKCIDMSAKPFVIQQEHCLHCGNCMEACPFDAVEKR